jgi:integration host factor subunit beta
MAEDRNTRADLIAAVHEKIGLEKGQIKTVLDFLVEEIKTSLSQRKAVEIRGFGTFEVRTRGARTGARNPRTGEAVAVAAHGVVAFKPGKKLKQTVWTLVDDAAEGDGKAAEIREEGRHPGMG